MHTHTHTHTHTHKDTHAELNWTLSRWTFSFLKASQLFQWWIIAELSNPINCDYLVCHKSVSFAEILISLTFRAAGRSLELAAALPIDLTVPYKYHFVSCDIKNLGKHWILICIHSLPSYKVCYHQPEGFIDILKLIFSLNVLIYFFNLGLLWGSLMECKVTQAPTCFPFTFPLMVKSNVSKEQYVFHW